VGIGVVFGARERGGRLGMTDEGAHCQRRLAKERHHFGVDPGGPWAVCGAGLKCCPKALLFILFISSFSFLFFLLISFISIAFDL
jgi:hypothetical protein